MALNIKNESKEMKITKHEPQRIIGAGHSME